MSPVTAEQLAEWKALGDKERFGPHEVIATSLTAVPALIAEVERLRDLLTRALPSVDADAAMMDAMDRHAPLPAQDMPSVTAAADILDALLADIRAALPEEPADG